MENLIRLLTLFACCLSFAGVNPATQTVNTWQLQYHKAATGDVTHPYENGFTWDYKSGIGVVFGGHLGTFYGMETGFAVPEIMNTNMTYAFSFNDFIFHKIFPMDRPPKRCGVKTVYDEVCGYVLSVAGGYHNYFNGYLEPNIRFSALSTEGAVNNYDMNYPIPIWGFSGKTGQWYALRPLIVEGLPRGVTAFDGYTFKMVHAKEYGLSLIAPPQYGRVYSYSAYLNQWTLLPKNTGELTGPESVRTCAAYDTRHRKMVTMYGNNPGNADTWTYDVGLHAWTKLAVTNTPTKSTSNSQGLFTTHSAIAYDRKNGVVLYLKNDGAETWALNIDSTQWVNLAPTGRPPSSGTGADGLDYDPVNNIFIVYTVANDEVWTYKYGSGIANRPESPQNVSGITDANGITLSWTVPSTGTAAVKYYIYRSQWDNNKASSSGLVPGPYVKIDSAAGLTCQDNSALLKSDSVFHSYFISAVSAQGVESDPSEPAFTVLPVPMGLVTTALSKNQVVLRWKPAKQPDIAGYNVYRFKGAYPRHNQMKTGKLNTAPVTGTSLYTDNTVTLSASVGANPQSTANNPQTETDSIVMYVVTAVNSLGKESGFSPYAVTQPDWANNLWIDTVNKFITWSPPRNKNIASYKVYAGAPNSWDGGSGFPTQVAVTTDTFWSYGNGTPSAYKVRALNTIGQNGFFSDVMPLKWKDEDDSGNFRADFMTEKPAVDTFFNNLPPVSIDEDGVAVPAETSIETYPNPFNPSIAVRIYGPKKAASEYSVFIYDAAGKKIADLSRSLKKDAPYSLSVSWDAATSASGTYLVEVVAGNQKMHKKIALLK